jgi:TolA-binding protein
MMFFNLPAFTATMLVRLRTYRTYATATLAGVFITLAPARAEESPENTVSQVVSTETQSPLTDNSVPSAPPPSSARTEAAALATGESAAHEAAPAPVHRRSASFETAPLSAKEAQGLVNLGGTLTDRGDFGAAEIAYRQVLNGKAPVEHTKSALLGLARMHRKQGVLTKAAAIYERYRKDYPSDDRVPDALLDLGRTLRDMGAPHLAISRFYNVINSTLKVSTSEGFEHYQLLAKTAQFEVAETHFQTGNFAEANKFFSRLRLLDLAPQDRARAHFKAAYSLQLAGDFEAAVTNLRAYLDQWPDDENVPEARYLLATSLRELKRPQEALVATIDLLMMEKSRMASDPKRWAYWQRRTGNQLANDFFQSGDVHNALAIYQSLAALSDTPNWKVPATYQVGLCYERLGDLERASTTYHTIVDGAGATPPADIADFARMAQSRLAHLAWRGTIDQQVTALFDSTTGQTAAPTSKPLTPNESERSAAKAPSAM